MWETVICLNWRCSFRTPYVVCLSLVAEE